MEGSSLNKEQKEQPVWTLNDFEIGKALGKGKYGVVWMAREKISGTQKIVALKVLFKEQIKANGITEQLAREIEIHVRVSRKSKHILKMYGWFQDDKRIYIVLEYAPGGELYKHMKNHENCRLTEPVVADYGSQIMRAVFELHKLNIIHRDIKPENILIGHDNLLKLADFGWCVSEKTGYKYVDHRRTTLCGTLDYLPPEMVEGLPYTESVDVWTIGVLLFEMLTGSCPFFSEGAATTYELIRTCTYKFPSHVSNSAKDLISKLLQIDPSKRPSLMQALQHPFFQKHGIRNTDL